ncbi:MAG: helix-turn-helix domain containing protein [Holophaga sp.]|nr:helix-turn-helix domain containing protein [Holophaga sp.]
MSTPAKSPTPRTRDAQATRDRILQAVGSLLVREGFGALGVNAVAREAGVDKVLIYRYFGGMDALLEAWGTQMNFWPSEAEILGPRPERDPARLAAGLLKRHLRALRRRPHTLEILAWETLARNPLTDILARIREARSAALMKALAPRFQGQEVDVEALSALLGAGLQHLLLRSRTVDVYGGIPIATAAGWTRIERALDQLCARLFPTRP